jgi:hypothetical protein
LLLEAEALRRLLLRSRATQAIEVQPENHRNALNGKVLHKTPVLAMAQTLQKYRKRTRVRQNLRKSEAESDPVYDLTAIDTRRS